MAGQVGDPVSTLQASPRLHSGLHSATSLSFCPLRSRIFSPSVSAVGCSPRNPTLHQVSMQGIVWGVSGLLSSTCVPSVPRGGGQVVWGLRGCPVRKNTPFCLPSSTFPFSFLAPLLPTRSLSGVLWGQRARHGLHAPDVEDWKQEAVPSHEPRSGPRRKEGCGEKRRPRL